MKHFQNNFFHTYTHISAKDSCFVETFKMIHGVISILIIAFVFILYTEIRKWQIKKQLRYFDSPKQFPIIGVAARFLGKPNDQIIETVLKLYDEVNSSPLQAWFGPILAIGIRY